METQLDLFNKDLDILNKEVLKDRVKNTCLQSINPLFTLTKWRHEDNTLPILYQFEKTPVGELLIAATDKGISYIGFVIDHKNVTMADLKRRFPENALTEDINEWLTSATAQVNNPQEELPLNFHLKGTDFQLSIWEKLLSIPFGGLVNYMQLGNGAADARAVGSAVGANPVSYLVPCHRVIRADGSFNGFFWGNEVKAGLLKYEAAPTKFPVPGVSELKR